MSRCHQVQKGWNSVSSWLRVWRCGQAPCGPEQGLGCQQVAEGSPSYPGRRETLGTCFLRAKRCVRGPLALETIRLSFTLQVDVINCTDRMLCHSNADNTENESKGCLVRWRRGGEGPRGGARWLTLQCSVRRARSPDFLKMWICCCQRKDKERCVAWVFSLSWVISLRGIHDQRRDHPDAKSLRSLIPGPPAISWAAWVPPLHHTEAGQSSFVERGYFSPPSALTASGSSQQWLKVDRKGPWEVNQTAFNDVR